MFVVLRVIHTLKRLKQPQILSPAHTFYVLFAMQQLCKKYYNLCNKLGWLFVVILTAINKPKNNAMEYANKQQIYQNSNSILEYKVKIKGETKKVFRKLQNRVELDSYSMQVFINLLSEDFGVKIPYVEFTGKQPGATNMQGRLTRKTLGVYSPALQGITIYKKTARQGKVLASKTALNTLIHEFVHHLDYVYSKLGGSLHTKGFYMRISWITNQLKS